MGKFSLNDILNNASLAEAGAVRKADEKREVIVELDLYDLIPSAGNFYDVSKLNDLVETIPVVGVLQPLLVKPAEEEPGKYDIIAGHRRWSACKFIVETLGKEAHRKLPCIIKEGDESAEDSDIINRLTLILSNRYRDISDYEKMTEVIELEKILEEAKERKSVRGVLQGIVHEMQNDDKKIRSRDILAAFAGISSTQVGRYKAIYNNLSFDLMMAFKNNRINVSVAYEASGLSESYQAKAVELLQGDGQLTINHIQGLKQKEKESTPIKGQQILPEAAPLQQETEVYGNTEKLPVPVSVKATEKTEEQLYDEEQKKIDRETKEKLMQMREDEQYEAHKQEEKRKEEPQTYELDFSIREFGIIYYDARSFLLLVDKGYKKDDTIIMHRMTKGERDAYQLEARVKEVIKDCTGLEDKYCILVLKVIRRYNGE